MVHCFDTLSTGHQRLHSKSCIKSQLYILMFIITSLQRGGIPKSRVCPVLTFLFENGDVKFAALSADVYYTETGEHFDSGCRIIRKKKTQTLF